jgi:vacuolar-type H+-ATPase subunit E/Vma4
VNCESLLESLRKGGEEEIRSAEAAMSEEIARIEQEISVKVAALKVQYEKNVQTDAAKRTEEILHDAHRKADLIRTASFRKLSFRLYQLAGLSLPLLRNERSEEVFDALKAELPALHWESVRVNPDDVAMAQRSFSGAEVIPDGTISGGMDVMSADGKIRIINTFEKRLERAWEDLRSDLLKEDFEAL